MEHNHRVPIVKHFFPVCNIHWGKDYLFTVGQETERAGVGKLRISGNLGAPCFGIVEEEMLVCLRL